MKGGPSARGNQGLSAILTSFLSIGVLLCSSYTMGADSKSKACLEVDITALRADVAFRQLAEQTGVKLLFAYDDARTRQVQAVRGCFSLALVIERLLQGSGLQSVRTPQGAYAITLKAEAEHRPGSRQNQ